MKMHKPISLSKARQVALQIHAETEECLLENYQREKELKESLDASGWTPLFGHSGMYVPKDINIGTSAEEHGWILSEDEETDYYYSTR